MIRGLSPPANCRCPFGATFAALSALLLTACASTGTDAREAEAQAGAAKAAAAAPGHSSGPHAPGRRIFEDCVSADAVLRYEHLVGERVLIRWAWNDPDAPSAQLRVPAHVLRLDAEAVAVDFDARMPNRAVYISAWMYSSHIRANSDGSFAVDPCSATFERGGW